MSDDPTDVSLTPGSELTVRMELSVTPSGPKMSLATDQGLTFHETMLGWPQYCATLARSQGRSVTYWSAHVSDAGKLMLVTDRGPLPKVEGDWLYRIVEVDSFAYVFELTRRDGDDEPISDSLLDDFVPHNSYPTYRYVGPLCTALTMLTLMGFEELRLHEVGPTLVDG